MFTQATKNVNIIPKTWILVPIRRPIVYWIDIIWKQKLIPMRPRLFAIG